MVMIGGNSRDSGKTTMACRIINKLSNSNEIIGLKVTSIRPDEADLHGNHTEDASSIFNIIEELDPGSHKDTSKMLHAGATRVYYIRVADSCLEEAILYFLKNYVKNQIIVCESRSLREIVVPGLYLMMMRLPAPIKAKDVSMFLSKADKVFYFGEDQSETIQYAANLVFLKEKFIVNQ